jgi:hypothetical protein
MAPAEADQVTAVFVDPFTDAVNCSVAPDDIAAFVGEIDIETVVGAVAEMVQEAVAV